MTSARREARWQEALNGHRLARSRFLVAGGAVSEEAWREPRAAGKWSPAQVTEHLILSYDVLLRELAGGPGMAVKAAWWKRALLRRVWLRRVLEGRFPEGVRAPRELRPGEALAGREEALARFEARGTDVERELSLARPDGNACLTHPWFGRLGSTDVLRLCASHVSHHRRQLPGGEAGAPGTRS